MEDVKLSRRSFGVARNTHTAKRIGSIGQDHLRMWSVWSDLECIPRCIFQHALGVLACWTISWNLSKKCFVLGFRCCQVALKLQKCIQNQPSAKLLCLCSFPLTHSSCVAVCPTSQAFSALCQETIKKKKKYFHVPFNAALCYGPVAVAHKGSRLASPVITSDVLCDVSPM